MNITDGYKVLIHWNPFQGLLLSSGNTALLDGCVDSHYWWYAIGDYSGYYKNCTPGPLFPNGENKVDDVFCMIGRKRIGEFQLLSAVTEHKHFLALEIGIEAFFSRRFQNPHFFEQHGVAVVESYVGKLPAKHLFGFCIDGEHVGCFQMRQDVIIRFSGFFLCIGQAVEGVGFFLAEAFQWDQHGRTFREYVSDEIVPLVNYARLCQRFFQCRCCRFVRLTGIMFYRYRFGCRRTVAIKRKSIRVQADGQTV